VIPTGSPYSAAKYEIDCSGREVARAPKWSGSVNYTHTFVLPKGDGVDLSLVATGKSRYWTGDELVTSQSQAGFMTGDVALTYRSPNEKWTLGAYCNNVTDRAYATKTFMQPVLGLPVGQMGDPRTYGMTGSYKF
jgi:iron complex outermembrane receptor protein